MVGRNTIDNLHNKPIRMDDKMLSVALVKKSLGGRRQTVASYAQSLGELRGRAQKRRVRRGVFVFSATATITWAMRDAWALVKEQDFGSVEYLKHRSGPSESNERDIFSEDESLNKSCQH